ncbi:DUF2878 domain-containing protein [Pandoraea sp. PE-S2R-1]|uniref:DUF2878 domain-containing protein n=1 Tax=Pandoraea sp. PE-S2R-1 TaxID=1986994 RepID=UPI002015F3C9|nr:DUF2878 domain-containing protein [Pandoraea sp. PE-S2R-1]
MTAIARRSQVGVYAIAGQIGWFACVLGAAHGRAWIGALVVAALACAHLAVTQTQRRELLFLSVVTICGWTWECVVVRTGWLRYPGDAATAYAPYWMASLWLLFALQINAVFRWLRGRWMIAALLGGIAGPLSFRAGVALGAAHLIAPVAALALIAVGWMVWLPALVWFGEKTDDAGSTRAASSA